MTIPVGFVGVDGKPAEELPRPLLLDASAAAGDGRAVRLSEQSRRELGHARRRLCVSNYTLKIERRSYLHHSLRFIELIPERRRRRSDRIPARAVQSTPGDSLTARGVVCESARHAVFLDSPIRRGDGSAMSA